MTAIWQSPWFIWAIIIGLGFPLLVILLSEWSARLDRQKRPLSATLNLVRKYLLPLLVIALMARFVLEIDQTAISAKLINTLFWLVALNTALALLNSVLFSSREPTSWQAQVPKLFLDILRVILVAIGAAIIASSIWGQDLGGFVTALGLGSVVIGLALQDTLGSIMSGITLLFERPFSVGDWIVVGDHTGKVVEMNWRAVRLVNLTEDLIVIPHLGLAGETIVNYSKPTLLHEEEFHLTFGYESDPNHVKAAMMEAALNTPEVLKEPAPYVYVMDFAADGILYEVRCFMEDYGQVEEFRDAFLSRAFYTARRYNITIPYPTRTVHMFDGPSVTDAGDSQRIIKAIGTMPLMRAFESYQATHLGKGIRLRIFGVDEKPFSINQQEDALYVIESGNAVMHVRDQSQAWQFVTALSAGDFYGGIELFSNEPKMLQITAVSDLSVIVIAADIVNDMLAHNAPLARELAQVVDSRIEAMYESLDQDKASKYKQNGK